MHSCACWRRKSPYTTTTEFHPVRIFGDTTHKICDIWTPFFVFLVFQTTHFSSASVVLSILIRLKRLPVMILSFWVVVSIMNPDLYAFRHSSSFTFVAFAPVRPPGCCWFDAEDWTWRRLLYAVSGCSVQEDLLHLMSIFPEDLGWCVVAAVNLAPTQTL